jgi:hypothetical protein
VNVLAQLVHRFDGIGERETVSVLSLPVKLDATVNELFKEVE